MERTQQIVLVCQQLAAPQRKTCFRSPGESHSGRSARPLWFVQHPVKPECLQTSSLPPCLSPSLPHLASFSEAPLDREADYRDSLIKDDLHCTADEGISALFFSLGAKRFLSFV